MADPDIPAISSKGWLPARLQSHAFQTDDPRLAPIHDKVLAGERLERRRCSGLYRTGDILAVGWMANSVRERMHGDKTYFNVNRHINPTNVCVAACRLVRLWPQERCAGRLHHGARRSFRDRGLRILRSGHRVSHRGRTASRPAVSVFSRSVLGLEAALSAGASQGVHHGRGGVSVEARQAIDPRDAGTAEGLRRGFAPRRRRGDFRRPRAPHHLRSQD